MKKLLLVCSLMGLGLGLYSCNSTATNSDIDVQTANVPGFNVSEFAALLKTTKDPNAIEQAINADGNKINNLDLNKNDTIDYLTVIEGKDNTITIVDQTTPTESITVATLTVNQKDQTINVAGNQAYCGDNYAYHSHYTVGDYLFMSYLLRPHAYYMTPYHYGYYPGFYHPYRSYYGYGYRSPNYRQTYYRNTRTNTVVNRSSNNSNYKSGSNSRYHSRASKPVHTSISTPKLSQRPFQVRTPSKPVRSGGFGSRPSSPRTPFGSSRSSFGSRSSGGRKR